MESKGVRVLSKEEEKFFDGITIENGKVQDTDFFETGEKISVIRIGNFTFRTDSIWVKILLGLIIAAVAAFLLFIALPVALIILGVLLVIWFILSFFGKK
ncbi:MAG: hypothetical protein J6I62_03465 [Selenomonadaceae bacterium]|nr:hypothetical protein [Selenomonadaceae bacterium]MBP3722295.1 hypothetical protein [Selenomonadaceae bacterium]